MRRAATPNCVTKDLYSSPAAGSTVSSSRLDVRWNPKCFGEKNMDLYLYKQASPMPIHVWKSVGTRNGQVGVDLVSQWWNGTDQAAMNLQIVPAGSQPWETSYPLSHSFVVNIPGGQTNPPAMSGTQYVTDMDPSSGQISHGGLAAAIVVPTIALLLFLAGAFYCIRKRAVKRDEDVYNASMYSKYADSPHAGMTQASSMAPRSVYDASQFDTSASTYAPYHADYAPAAAAPALTESQVALQPGDSFESSQDDYSYPDATDDSTLALAADPPKQRVTSMTRMYYASQPRTASRRSLQHPDAWFESGTESFDPDTIPSTREEAERQTRYSTRGNRDARMRRRNDALPAIPHALGLYEPYEAAVPAPAARGADMPPATEPKRESFSFIDTRSKRRVSAGLVDATTREEKVSSFLAQLPSGNAYQNTEGGRATGRDTSMSARSRPKSMDSSLFHDAFE